MVGGLTVTHDFAQDIANILHTPSAAVACLMSRQAEKHRCSPNDRKDGLSGETAPGYSLTE